MPKFTVDTHLFRELGELLVGRDSTALIELVKNAYDADATQVTLYGEGLDDHERGFIRVADDGSGMTAEQFENGFLRIASRSKEQGGRRSGRFGRRFTGAKGIGRLAAHKLARLIEIESLVAAADGRAVLKARIDWDIVEQHETLDQLEHSEAIVVDSQSSPGARRSGTTITLRRLRRRWTPAQRSRFLQEIEAFEPPAVLIRSLSPALMDTSLLFGQPTLREGLSSDPGFRVHVEGEFAGGDDLWQVAASAARWVIEIEARDEDNTVRYAVAPTKLLRTEKPELTTQYYTIDHPTPSAGPFFQARILVNVGGMPGAAAVEWARRSAGVRVFLEGFRILPYGEPNNDWLLIDADYARRGRSFGLFDKGVLHQDAISDKDAALSRLPNRAYFGAVFLTSSGSRSLRALVNREGFVPEAAYDSLVDLIHTGVELSVRARAAANSPERAARRETRAGARSSSPEAAAISPATASIERAVQASMHRATALAAEARQLVVSGELPRAADTISQAVAEVEETAQLADTLIDERSMLRILASAGTQLAAFIHEINGLVGMAQAIDTALVRIRKLSPLSPEVRGELGQLHSALGDLRRTVERQASYLIDVVTPDARRRRLRLGLAERFDAAVRLVSVQVEKWGIVVRNEIPANLKSPTMFPAELTTVFSNLLTNAVKAAGPGGSIRAFAQELDDGRTRVCIENTGIAVDLSGSENWFRPFQSTTAAVDSVLGQGMGLGLPITRSMLEEYGSRIRFIAPSDNYATAIEIIFSS